MTCSLRQRPLCPPRVDAVPETLLILRSLSRGAYLVGLARMAMNSLLLDWVRDHVNHLHLRTLSVYVPVVVWCCYLWCSASFFFRALISWDGLVGVVSNLVRLFRLPRLEHCPAIPGLVCCIISLCARPSRSFLGAVVVGAPVVLHQASWGLIRFPAGAYTFRSTQRDAIRDTPGGSLTKGRSAGAPPLLVLLTGSCVCALWVSFCVL